MNDKVFYYFCRHTDFLSVRVAIIGTRGIPNNYGGFEQFAEYFSVFMASKGHSVYVYCPHNHPYQEDLFFGVTLIRCFDPEYKIGTAGQFIYDLNCILHSRKLKPDVILNLGYTSSAVFMRFFRKTIPVATNMDGLEWKRTKYNKWVQKFIKYSESLAAKRSQVLIADSLGIKSYLLQEYNKESVYIPYGATPPEAMPGEEALADLGLKKSGYNLILARMEPENNIETILEGIAQSHSEDVTVVIGNFKNAYGQYLYDRYNARHQIRFIGAIYDLKKLRALRYHCSVYFHGHSVGGTNPSLLEAMADGAFICAHRNEFNQYVLASNAVYFSNSGDVKQIVTNGVDQATKNNCRQANLSKIKTEYNWNLVNEQYENTLLNAVAFKR